MISIVPTNDTTPELSYPVSDNPTDTTDREKDFYIEVRRPASIDGAFDLFAEARQIYARARSSRRIQSSSII